MKTIEKGLFLSFGALLFACGPVKVTYNMACVATCPSTGTTAAVSLTACDVDGQDPNTIAAQAVTTCVNGAKANCADVTCGCQVTRTTTVCQ
jgi:hypothetical protein